VIAAVVPTANGVDSINAKFVVRCELMLEKVVDVFCCDGRNQAIS
jgi:hypothetical protein